MLGSGQHTNKGVATMTGEKRDNTQAQQQQDMNAQQQQQAAEQTKQSRAQKPGPTIKVNGQEVPFYAEPRSHSSTHVSRLAVRAQSMAKDANAKHQLPEAATPEAVAKSRHVPMPAGGLSALADSLWPDDVDNQDAMDQHLFDLMTLNRDTLRDDTSHSVGQMVRVPG